MGNQLVLAGGLESSGTTWLLRELARRSDVVGLNEIGVFSHPGMFENFEGFKEAYLASFRTKLHRNIDFFARLRLGLNPKLVLNNTPLVALGTDSQALLDDIADAKTLSDCLTRLTRRLLEAGGRKQERPEATRLLEKTPANIFSAHAFARAKAGRAIVIVRDPVDNVVSLLHRCVPLANAMAGWALAAQMALALRDVEGCLIVRYEDLVSKPQTLQLLGESLFGKGEAANGGRADITRYPSEWRNDPNAGPSDRSVGRGRGVLDARDLALFAELRLVDAPALGWALQSRRRIGDIAGALGYDSLRHTAGFSAAAARKRTLWRKSGHPGLYGFDDALLDCFSLE